MDVLPKSFLPIILAAKWLMRHSRTSPKQSSDDLCLRLCLILLLWCQDLVGGCPGKVSECPTGRAGNRGPPTANAEPGDTMYTPLENKFVFCKDIRSQRFNFFFESSFLGMKTPGPHKKYVQPYNNFIWLSLSQQPETWYFFILTLWCEIGFTLSPTPRWPAHL